MKTIETTINGTKVPVVSRVDVAGVPHIKEWAQNIDGEFDVRSIEVADLSIDYRNPTKPYVRSARLRVGVGGNENANDVSYLDVHTRNPAVVILVVLKYHGGEYALLVAQKRLPTGVPDLLEIVAGTMDGINDFKQNAVRELEEETTIKAKPEELIDLIELIYGDQVPGVFPTPGVSSEYYKIFLLRKEVSIHELDLLRYVKAGNKEEGEETHTVVVYLDELPLYTYDAKSLSALMLYKTAKQMDKL